MSPQRPTDSIYTFYIAFKKCKSMKSGIKDCLVSRVDSVHHHRKPSRKRSFFG